MAEEQAPESQDLEEARRLKEAVARLGASLREESERLSQDPTADLPIAAAPRVQPDPRLAELGDAIGRLAALEEHEAARAIQEGELARRRDEETRRLANRALVIAVVAAVLATVALVAAIAATVSS